MNLKAVERNGHDVVKILRQSSCGGTKENYTILI